MLYRDPSTQGGILRVFTGLMGLPPVGQIVAGTIVAIGVPTLTFFLWELGVVWGATSFLCALGGVALMFSGVSALRRQRDLGRQQAILKAREGELVDGVLALNGRGVAAWLDAQGITSVHLRGHVIRLAREKGKVRGPPQPT